MAAQLSSMLLGRRSASCAWLQWRARHSAHDDAADHRSRYGRSRAGSGVALDCMTHLTGATTPCETPDVTTSASGSSRNRLVAHLAVPDIDYRDREPQPLPTVDRSRA